MCIRDRGEEDGDSFKEEYAALIEEVKADQVKCKIYLLSVLGDSERVKAINGQIKEIAEQNSVEMCIRDRTYLWCTSCLAKGMAG